MNIFTSPLENRKGKLFFDGVAASELAEKYDTPLYVISENRVRDNYRRVKTALCAAYPKVDIHYAAKANTNIAVLKILESAGCSLDAVSPGEVATALRTGFTPQRILFTGTSVRNDELKALVDFGVEINLDATTQLERLLKITVPQSVSFRINPAIGAGHHSHVVTAGKESKFGIWENDAPAAYARAKEAGVKRFGIHMHIGAGILEPKPFAMALDKLLSVAADVRKKTGIEFEFIDMGGGLGVPYKPSENELDLKLFADTVLEPFKKNLAKYGLGQPTLYLELGRYLICDACVLLTRVNTIKITPHRKFAGTDAGFNTLIRPLLYNSYHHILATEKLNNSYAGIYDITGPICESGDLLAKERPMPVLEEGDLLAVMDAGAYGFSMSSPYNSRPRAMEILVRDGQCAIVRDRETLEDMLCKQHLPEWL
jgi:diaminopimelate decarboxylase